jgi:hypothetical protein
MPQRIAKLNDMANVLADLAKEAVEMGEHNLASLIIAAFTEAQRRSLGISESLNR